MLDMWTDVFNNIGSRTTGTKPGHYAIVAPGWTGALSQGLEKIVAPTSTVWVMGRTQTNGPADHANVHKVQDGYELTPLDQWGQAYMPPERVPTDPSIDNKTPPLTQINELDGVVASSGSDSEITAARQRLPDLVSHAGTRNHAGKAF
jgi:hypothetical protein